MKWKKWKRFAALSVSAALTILALSGCQGSGGSQDAGGQDKNGASAKGRYMEEDMELPLQDGEKVLNLARSKDGNPVLFAQSGVQVKRYEYGKTQWNESSLDWFHIADDSQENYILEVQEAGDGTQFVCWMDEDGLTHIARGGEGKEMEELAIPHLSQETEYGYQMVTGFALDNAGNFWLQEPYGAKIVVIDKDSLDTVEEINTVKIFNMSQRLVFPGDGVLAVNTEERVYTIFDENRETKGILSLEASESAAMCADQEHWYAVSEEGITRMTVGNDIREVVMEGSMGAMGSTTNFAAGMICGNEEDFYVLYSQEKEGAHSLKHYVYAAEAAAVPAQTLRVFGLSDSDTIREAAVGFQKKYPDVKVEFTTSGKQPGEVTSDDIRTLNTELLGGNGADVLLLEGLPVDAYIEKGILSDLTDLAEELMESDAYLEKMLQNTVQKDGKIYGLPAKFSVPVIYGNEDVKHALQSLESLNAFLETDPSASIFGIADRFYIRDFLFEMYQEEIFGEDAKVDQEKLTEMLELAEKISVNARADLFDEILLEQGDRTRDPFSNYGSEGIMNRPDAVSTYRIASIPGMIIPYEVMRRLSLTPDTIRGFYLPGVIAGVNKNTSQTETASEFVKYLFSPEVQGAQLEDGFPVLKSALNDRKNEAGSEYAEIFSMMSSMTFDDEVVELEAGYPTVDEVEDLMQKCDTLDTPSEQNRVIWNLYQEEADQFMEGNIDAATAARNVAQKVDTYLAE